MEQATTTKASPTNNRNFYCQAYVTCKEPMELLHLPWYTQALEKPTHNNPLEP